LLSYVFFVLRTIDALKFAFEWKKKLSERGGQKWKMEYRELIFQKHHEKELENFEIYKPNQKKQMTRSLKSKFVRKHERVITGRYQLLELYKTVRAPRYNTTQTYLSSSSESLSFSTLYGVPEPV
jgi:hypothetical protein